MHQKSKIKVGLIYNQRHLTFYRILHFISFLFAFLYKCCNSNAFDHVKTLRTCVSDLIKFQNITLTVWLYM